MPVAGGAVRSWSLRRLGGGPGQVDHLVDDAGVHRAGDDRDGLRVARGGLGVGAGQVAVLAEPGRGSRRPPAPAAPGSWRSCDKGMWTTAWVSAPARAGTRRARSSRVQASCSASWNRCPSVRSSSGPAFLPRASSTARTAVAHSGVRSPRITPASPKVVPELHVPVAGVGVVRVGLLRAARSRSRTRRWWPGRRGTPRPRRPPAGSGRSRRASRRGQLAGPVGDGEGEGVGDVPGGQRAAEQRALAELAHLPDRGPARPSSACPPSRPATMTTSRTRPRRARQRRRNGAAARRARRSASPAPRPGRSATHRRPTRPGRRRPSSGSPAPSPATASACGALLESHGPQQDRRRRHRHARRPRCTSWLTSRWERLSALLSLRSAVCARCESAGMTLAGHCRKNRLPPIRGPSTRVPVRPTDSQTKNTRSFSICILGRGRAGARRAGGGGGAGQAGGGRGRAGVVSARAAGPAGAGRAAADRRCAHPGGIEVTRRDDRP